MVAQGPPHARTTALTTSTLLQDHLLFLVLLLGRSLDLRSTPEGLGTVLALLACSPDIH